MITHYCDSIHNREYQNFYYCDNSYYFHYHSALIHTLAKFNCFADFLKMINHIPS